MIACKKHMQSFSDEEFNILKSSQEEWYRTVGEVSCGYFPGEKIRFNAKGLEHLKFKTKNHARPVGEQYIRFKLLRLTTQVIKLSRTVQGISQELVWELVRSNQRNDRCLVSATFYEFIAVIGKVRVKVIVKQVENGPKYFWSIIPSWKTDPGGKRRVHTGNPESD